MPSPKRKIVPVMLTDTVCLSSIAIMIGVSTIYAYSHKYISLELSKNIILGLLILFLIYSIIIKIKENKLHKKGY